MCLFLLTSPLALLGSGARWLPDLSCSSVQPCSEVLCVHRGQSRLFSPWHYCLCATHIMPWDLQGLYRTFICQYKSEAWDSYQEELQNNCFREAACLHYSGEARLYFWIMFNSLHPLPGTHECWRPLKSEFPGTKHQACLGYAHFGKSLLLAPWEFFRPPWKMLPLVSELLVKLPQNHFTVIIINPPYAGNRRVN